MVSIIAIRRGEKTYLAVEGANTSWYLKLGRFKTKVGSVYGLWLASSKGKTRLHEGLCWLYVYEYLSRAGRSLLSSPPFTWG